MLTPITLLTLIGCISAIISKEEHEFSPGTVIIVGDVFEIPMTCNLTLKDNGAFIYTSTDIELWHPKIYGWSTQYLIFGYDGNLIIYDFWINKRWSSGTDGINATLLVFRGNCELIMYNSDNVPVWHTGPGVSSPHQE